MLKARNLDDQTYEEIVQAAEGRLPWLCPVWTDHNAHDPGITILELMAWYKELQQYHMNQFTDELRCKLLKLAGITRRPAAPARCAVELGSEAPERLEGERLETREEIPFELAEAVPAQRPVLAQIRVVQGDRSRDVGELLGDRAITFQPFAQAGGECSALHIGLSQLGEGDLRLWFEVVPPEGTPRNPFSDPEQAPRTIRWTCLGAEGTRLVRDDTHALSVSGYVVLRPEGEWPAGGDGLHWLTLTLEDPGCEEEVRLSGVSAGRYSALQLLPGPRPGGLDGASGGRAGPGRRAGGLCAPGGRLGADGPLAGGGGPGGKAPPGGRLSGGPGRGGQRAGGDPGPDAQRAAPV